MPHDGFYGTVVTEVQVVHSTASSAALPEPKMAHLQSAAHVSFEETEARVQPATSSFFSSITSQPNPHRSPIRRITSATNTAMAKFLIEDPVKRAYLRTSFLFGLSVLVTWIPSSMNRIHGWLSGSSPFQYHVATASVLPLQGLWNAIIFFVTSWRILREGVLDWRAERRGSDVNLEAGREMEERVERGESILDDGDSGTMGSDVELRRMAEAPGKRSASL